MKVFTAPDPTITKEVSFFLGGGISNCPEWQKIALDLLSVNDNEFTVYNPRRDHYEHSRETAIEQIEWEFERLSLPYIIKIFWFPKVNEGPWDQCCPITLLELGESLAKKERPFVGCDPRYTRKLDVEKQCKLRGVRVESDLEAMIDRAILAIAWE